MLNCDQAMNKRLFNLTLPQFTKKERRKRVYSCPALLILAATISTRGGPIPPQLPASPRPQAATPQETIQRQRASEVKSLLPSRHSGWATMGEFEDKTESPERRQHRLLRESHLGRLSPISSEPYNDPGLLVDGQPETIGVVFIDYVVVQKLGTENAVPELRGIPASMSNAVIVGTILSGKSFMSSKHDNVYSDYQIRVDQILKPDNSANLAVGQQLIASRTGGKIHFPSGHITNFYIAGRGLPKIGSQYILFLIKPASDLPEYRIGFPAGYEITNAHVYPLDDVNQEYEGMSEQAFLGIVRDAIAAAKGGE
ncbi:MAG TPA: hypothetical protein VEL77_02825 [Rugosimonospora sp.]|nr:hypothetical protein [Rugosimonospora sp.]